MYFLPDINDPLLDPEPWSDLLSQVEGRESEFAIFESMSGRMVYATMLDFTYHLESSSVKDDLEFALRSHKPIQNFKFRVENSPFREEWFNFRFKAHMEWVRSQLNCYELVS
jgi:hypothetical protein